MWSPKEGAPLLVGEAFFKGGVMDLAWTPDGYSLLVASYDGTIAVCRFEEAELGEWFCETCWNWPQCDLYDLGRGPAFPHVMHTQGLDSAQYCTNGKARNPMSQVP